MTKYKNPANPEDQAAFGLIWKWTINEENFGPSGYWIAPECSIPVSPGEFGPYRVNGTTCPTFEKAANLAIGRHNAEIARAKHLLLLYGDQPIMKGETPP